MLPRYRLILLFVTQDAASERAAAHAARIAAKSGATVAILGIIDVSAGFSFSAEGAAMYDRLRAETQRAIQSASAVMRTAGVLRVEHLIMDGDPRDAVLEVADEQGADIVVIGAEDELSATLIRAARYPVLVVPREGR